MKWITFVLGLVLASGVWAQSLVPCEDFAAGQDLTIINPGNCSAVEFTTANNADSPSVYVIHGADFCFNPNLDGSAGDARLVIRKLQEKTGVATGDRDDNSVPMNLIALDGSALYPCWWGAGPGWYYGELTADPNSGHTSRMTVDGY